MDDLYGVDRDRGILTEADRRYLAGEDDLEGQDERNARYRIRNRTVHALVDVRLLEDQLSDRDLRQVANADVLELPAAVHAGSLIGLSYRLLVHNDSVTNPIEAFKRMAETALEAAESDRRPVDREPAAVDASVEVEITEESVDPEEAARLLRLLMGEEEYGDGFSFSVSALAGDPEQLRDELRKLLDEE